ncbi:MAG: D-2-hydroxyacid dehydrogenase [Candidatus Cloacimonetes bacterium]|nr:D-2-hydroxyacid dehydrogenase [Candidatus Cloacimonadota bacterium]MBL7108256.1 D-2-hydroxyacid dehydrogenase [Candidatus Cloacimonadota bacterium]
MAKILISDPVSQKCIEMLENAGHELVFKTDKKTPEQLAEIIKGFDTVVVRSATKVRKVAIDAADNLKLIVRGGVGLDNIDCDYAKSKGIKVSNTPTASSQSVAELALAHMLALYRFLPNSNITMRNGEWNKKKYKGNEVAGKTLGIIGFGNIGKSLATKAIALGMKVVAYDPFVNKTDLNVELVNLEKLFETSEIISLHIPHTDETHYIIDQNAIAKMKDGVMIINCARGGVVDENAFLAGLNSGKIAYAGIDSYEEEPTQNMELVNHPNVSATPHIGAATKEAQARVGVEVADIIIDFFK